MKHQPAEPPETEPSATCIVQLTPPGRAALATCLVLGPQAVALVTPLVSRLPPPGRIVLARWSGSQPEDVIVATRPGAVAIHCHGGDATVRSLLSDLAGAGGVEIGWREWIAREHADPIVAAAAAALAGARTERAAAILLDQYQGALSHSLRATRDALQTADGDCSRSAFAAKANAELKQLLDRAAVGRHLTTPWRITLFGDPNVGKSSLINALLGYARAIVLPEPGTTRDVLSATTAIDGWPVELCDTAGLRAADSMIERAGIEAAAEALAAADLRILVLDRAASYGAAQQKLLNQWPEALVVHNKSDLPAHPSARPAGIEVSATQPAGIDNLLAAIAARLVPAPPPAGAGVPFTVDQIAGVSAARDGLSRGDIAAAIAEINVLLGELPPRAASGWI